MKSAFSSLAGTLEVIGNTPMVRLSSSHDGPGEIYAKAEFLQPGGSVKDRAALKILERAYETATLLPGQSVVEMTSGNMGAGLAVVCAALNHPFIAVISAGNSPARVKMMRDLGAQVIVVPQVDGRPGRVTGKDLRRVEEEAVTIATACGGYYVDQFNNPGCDAAHFEGTGPEIWSQLDGQIDAFVAAVGSGGTFVGTARYLKSRNSEIFCAAVEPENARVLQAGKNADGSRAHVLQGTGYGFVPPQFDMTVMDVALSVSDEEAVRWRTKLAKQEGLHVGYSAAANVCAADALLKSGKVPKNARVATILCDTGLKYD